MKYIWLGIALFALCTGVYYAVLGQWKDALFFFVIVLIGMLMFKVNLNRQHKYYINTPS